MHANILLLVYIYTNHNDSSDIFVASEQYNQGMTFFDIFHGYKNMSIEISKHS